MAKTKICIVGDSHVAALKRGWDMLAPFYPDVQMAYLAKQSGSLKAMVQHDNMITLRGVPGKRYLKKTFGYTELDVSEVDCFLCVGMMPAIQAFVPLQAAHALASQGQISQQYVSNAAYIAAFGDMFDTAVLGHVVRILDEAGAKQGYVTLDPRRSEILLDLDAKSTPVYERLIATGEGRILSELLARAVRGKLPERFHYLAPPADLLVADVLTRAEFSVGSVRLKNTAEHPSGDVKHMNANYGARMLEALFERIGLPIVSQADQADKQ